jgi:formylglycine-generating enzyme required for sulfatase activity
LHQVTLTHGFEIMSTEVTQGEFQSVMGYNPSYFTSCGSHCPVEKVSWHMSVAYCNALSQQAGLQACYSCSGSGTSVTCQEASGYTGQAIYSCPGYRLPTEAEWEYAYRAGTQTSAYNGTITNCSDSDSTADQIGWYYYNSGNTTHPVGKKAPNAWGLYDMAGNVYEWTHDWYEAGKGTLPVTNPLGPASGSYRVNRGGSWNFHASYLRAAYRKQYTPTNQSSYGSFGLRCSRTILP